MKTFLRNLPIKHKLMALTVVISGVALLVAVTTFAIYEQGAFKRTMARDFAILADMFNDNVAPGLAFNDVTSMEETLRALAANQRITAAGVYDIQGVMVATYLQSRAVRDGFKFPAVRPAGQHWGAGRLDTFADIELAGEVIGTIYIGTDLGELRERLWRYAAIVVLLLLGCSLVALGLATRLQGIISRPIEDLAQTVATIAATKDYSVRARKESADELGRLIDGFNEMLAQIQARDSALGSARDNLEKRVEDRTVALKLAREEAVVEQLRFKLIFDMVPVGISYYLVRETGDAEPLVGLINDAHLRICGLTREEARDQANFKRLNHPEDHERQRVLEVQLNGGEIDRYTMEKRYLRPDGKTVWVVFSTRRIRHADGLREHLTTVVDITDLKLAQEQAAQEQARFKLIFEGVPVGLSYTWHPPGERAVFLVNDAHLHICGLTREQASDPMIFKRISHPEDRERQMEWEVRFQREEIDRYALEKRYVRPDGQTVWVAFTTERRNYPDGLVVYLSTVVDITELKLAQAAAIQSEARLRFIFEAVPFSVTWVRYQTDKNETLQNNAFFRITGLSREQIVSTDVMRRLTHPQDLQRQDELRARIELGEIDDFAMEKRYVRPDGAVVWVALTIAVFRGPDGRILQEVSTLADITERKQVEAELDKTHQLLLESSRYAGMAEVATGVLHNVGNVLNSVNVSATLVADHVRHTQAANVAKIADLFAQHQTDLADFLTRDTRGQLIPGYLGTLAESLAAEHKAVLVELDHLRKNVEHIKDIVAMQQAYARTSGVIEPISLPDLIEDALRINSGSLARHDVDTIRDYQARPVITTDKHKVMQILINLVRNAKYACDESGRTDKRITVRTTSDERGVRIVIADNGVGIPAEILTQIFNHGFTTRKAGHGFGLHSSALAAKELGGALAAQSAGTDQGATFTLELPYKPVSSDHENAIH